MARHYYQIKDLYPMLRYPEKYRGTRPITMRSSWETKLVLKWLDINENILEWNSETVVIPYFLPTDGKTHRYFMDFYAKCKDTKGNIVEMLIEVKPFKSTIAPVKPKKVTKGFLTEVQDWIKNSAKWEATEVLCEQLRQKGRNIKFLKITEKDCPFFIKG